MCYWDQELRGLTPAEWEKIKRAVKKYEFPCLLLPGAYGFYLAIHDCGDMFGIKTDALLVISHHQFPFPSAEKGFNGQEETLRRLEPITHRSRNIQLLEFYGFEPLKEVMSYGY